MKDNKTHVFIVFLESIPFFLEDGLSGGGVGVGWDSQ